MLAINRSAQRNKKLKSNKYVQRNKMLASSRSVQRNDILIDLCYTKKMLIFVGHGLQLDYVVFKIKSYQIVKMS